MQIKVYTIDVRVPRWLKRATLFGLIPAVVLLGAAHYLRADVPGVPVTVPNVFQDGEVLSAQKMVANFDTLKTGINTLGTAVTTLEGTVATQNAGLGSRVAALESGPIVKSVRILSDGSLSNLSGGNWIQSVAVSNFNFSVTLSPGAFANPPNCSCTPYYLAGGGCTSLAKCSISGLPTTQNVAYWFSYSSSSAAGYDYTDKCNAMLVCTGDR